MCEGRLEKGIISIRRIEVDCFLVIPERQLKISVGIGTISQPVIDITQQFIVVGWCAFCIFVEIDGCLDQILLVEELITHVVQGKTVFVLGAGGVARAIVMYLGNGPKEIFVTDIDDRAVGEMKKQFEKYYDPGKFKAVNKNDIKEALDASDLLVQTSPVGMHDGDPSPIEPGLLHTGLRVYDVIYNRPKTKLVEEATKRKLHAVTGLGMLLNQGTIAFNLWTWEKAPVEVMRRALKEALRSNQVRSRSDK